MVAVRTAGLSFESLIGLRVGGENRLVVSPAYLGVLARIANGRFAENARRVERFRDALRNEAEKGNFP